MTKIKISQKDLNEILLLPSNLERYFGRYFSSLPMRYRQWWGLYIQSGVLGDFGISGHGLCIFRNVPHPTFYSQKSGFILLELPLAMPCKKLQSSNSIIPNPATFFVKLKW